MNTRHEALPFGITLLLSLVLHGAVVLLIPGLPFRRQPPKQDFVTVELQPKVKLRHLPSKAAARSHRLRPRASKPRPDQHRRAVQPETKPSSTFPSDTQEPAAVPSDQGDATNPPAPEAPSPPQQTPSIGPEVRSSPDVSPPPAPPAELASEAAPKPQTAAASGPPETPKGARLRDLMPKAPDLASFRSAAPTGDQMARAAEEPTINLRDTSSRYGVYANQVREAVDAAWSNWKEALLAAGRSGVVVVRFTLDPDGTVEQVSFDRRSGSPILDNEAENAIRNAKLPPFPSYWTIARLHLIAQFDYLLQ